MGIPPPCRVAIFAASTSTQVRWLPDSARQVPVTSPTEPVPMTVIFTGAPRLEPGSYHGRRTGVPGHRVRAAAWRLGSGRHDQPGGRFGPAHDAQPRGILDALHDALHRC